MQLVGLDVGFSTTRATSGVSTLVSTILKVGRATSTATGRRKLLESVSTADVVAIDGPLLSVLDGRIRPCERLFARGGFQHRCKPGFSHVKGTGLQLRNAGLESALQLRGITSCKPLVTPAPLVCSPRNIVEAFPNAFLGVCVSAEQYISMPTLRRGRKFDWLYSEWCRMGTFRLLTEELAEVLPEDFPSHCDRNHDHEERAALICLTTAASVVKGRYTAVGEPLGGYFFLPPWSLWADWARTELDTQRSIDASIAVWIDGVAFSTEEALP